MPNRNQSRRPAGRLTPSFTSIGDVLRFVVPVKLDSPQNGSFGNRFAHTKDKNALQEIVAKCLAQSTAKPALPVDVILTRVGVQVLDDDNLSASFKYVRDEIARWIGVDDGKRRMKTFQPHLIGYDQIRFRYAEQERGPDYGIRIEMRTRSVDDATLRRRDTGVDTPGVGTTGERTGGER